MTSQDHHDHIQRLELERLIQVLLTEQRKTNDSLYAIKLTERVVFGFVGLIAVSFVAALLKLVLAP